MNPYQTILTHHKIPMNFIIRPLSTIFNHIKPPLIHINSKEVHHESASESLTTLSLLRREALGGGRSATLGLWYGHLGQRAGPETISGGFLVKKQHG